MLRALWELNRYGVGCADVHSMLADCLDPLARRTHHHVRVGAGRHLHRLSHLLVSLHVPWLAEATCQL